MAITLSGIVSEVVKEIKADREKFAHDNPAKGGTDRAYDKGFRDGVSETVKRVLEKLKP